MKRIRFLNIHDPKILLNFGSIEIDNDDDVFVDEKRLFGVDAKFQCSTIFFGTESPRENLLAPPLAVAGVKIIDRFVVDEILSTRSTSENPPSMLAAPLNTEDVGVPGEDLKESHMLL